MSPKWAQTHKEFDVVFRTCECEIGTRPLDI